MPEAGRTRHLLYHVWPHRADDGVMWRWNIAELKRRLPLFNGRRVVAIAEGPKADSPDAVKAALGPDVEYVVMPNDPALREVTTFKAMFSRVSEFVGPGDATFYAHAKGVSNLTWGPRSTIKFWAAAMYEACLDWWPQVREALRIHAAAGAFKRTIRGWAEAQSQSAWHYTGSFFWFRNRDLFARDWRRIDRFEHGIEPYLSLHFPQEWAAALVCEDARHGLYLYEPAQWAEVCDGPLARARVARDRSPDGVFLESFRALSGKPRVLEIGTRAQGDRSGHWKGHLSRARPDYDFVGLDIEPGEGVDVVADVHELSAHFPPGHFDAFVCRSTLEHVRRPWDVARELAKVCRPGAVGFVGTHQSFPLHDYPADYFRFSREALAEVFGLDAGWSEIASGYAFPAKVLPLSNTVQASGWDFEAPAWLNVACCVERV